MKSPLFPRLLAGLAFGFTPPLGAASVTLAPAPGAVFDEAPGELIDIIANEAYDAAALARQPGFAVVRDWTGFEGRGLAKDFSNFGLLPGGATLRGRLLFKNPVDMAVWAGRATSRAEHPIKALNTVGDTAIIFPGSGHMVGYELALGSGADATFKSDRAVRALGFVITNIMPGEVVRAEFYSASGALLVAQDATGVAVEGAEANYQGQEIFFGHVAPSDPASHIQRVVIRINASNQYKDWALAAAGFTPPVAGGAR